MIVRWANAIRPAEPFVDAPALSSTKGPSYAPGKGRKVERSAQASQSSLLARQLIVPSLERVTPPRATSARSSLAATTLKRERGLFCALGVKAITARERFSPRIPLLELPERCADVGER
jgi:hypothetical protein